MPVQTRNKTPSKPSSSASSPTTKKASPLKKAAPKRSAHDDHVEDDVQYNVHVEEKQAKKQKTVAAPAAAKKQAKKSDAMLTDDANSNVKEFFENVVGEIGQYGSVIKSSVLSSYVAPVEKAQDPSKAAKRKTIGAEIRRMSVILASDDDVIPPTKVKARTLETQKRREKAAKQMQKNLVKQISSIGANNLKKVLQEKRSRRASAAHKITVQTSHADSKVIQKKTLKELKQLVSPLNTRDYRPSFVKSKIDVKKAKAEVNAEIVKTATVRQIKTLGNNLKSVLKSSKKVAAKAQKTQKVGKK